MKRRIIEVGCRVTGYSRYIYFILYTIYLSPKSLFNKRFLF